MAHGQKRTAAVIVGLAISLVAIVNTRQHVVPAEFFRQLTETDTPPTVILESIRGNEHGS